MRKLWPAGGLVAAAVLTACGHPATGPVQPAAERAPATAESAVPGANRPLPNAAPPATGMPAVPSVTPTRTVPAPPTTAPPHPPPPRTGPPRPPTRTTPPMAPSTKKARAKPTGSAYPPGTWVLHIGTWSRPVVRGIQATIDRCKAAVLFTGPAPDRADGYKMSTSVIVGHDFCGYSVLAPLPIGTHVTLDMPGGTISYHVYANYITPGQGGPDSGLYWGDLTLQTCVGPDTGFSYLTRDRGSPRRAVRS